MIKIALLENDVKQAKNFNYLLQRFIQEIGIECELATYTDGVDFVSDYIPCFDIIFIDTEMPIMDGMEIALRLRRVDREIPIIFISDKIQLAIRGYEVEALDFMMKPIEYVAFVRKMDKAIKYIEQNNNHNLILKTQDGFQKVNIKDIKYIEVFGHFLIYHTRQKDIQVRGVLSRIEEELEPYNFSRCSHCFLINFRYVESFNATMIEVGGVQLPISRRKKKKFSEKLTAYFLKSK